MKFFSSSDWIMSSSELSLVLAFFHFLERVYPFRSWRHIVAQILCFPIMWFFGTILFKFTRRTLEWI